MPRLRTILLGAVVVVATGGLGAGLAWRWVLREAIAKKERRQPTWAELSRCGDWLAIGIGLVFLPVTWGGVIAFLSPLAVTSGHAPRPWPSILAIGVVILGVGAYLALLYRFLLPGAIGEGVEWTRNPRAWIAGWATHLSVAVAAGLPGAACWLAIDSAPLSAFLLPLTALAFLAPGTGALVALPVVVRRFEIRGDPVTSTRKPESVVIPLVAGLGLLVLWAATLHNVFAAPDAAPVLAHDDFDTKVCGQPVPWYGDEAPRARGAIMAAGEPCDERGSAGQVEIDGARLAWCTRWDTGGVQKVAIARLGPGEPFVRTFRVASRSVVPMAAGLAIVLDPSHGRHERATEAASDPHVVLVGSHLIIRTSWPIPRESHAQSGYVLAPQPNGGLVAGWRRGGDFGLVNRDFRFVHLDRNLRPTGLPRQVDLPRYFYSVSSSTGRKTCLRFHTHLMGQGLLVLDGAGKPWTPGLWERACTRAGFWFYVLGGLALLMAFLVFKVVRAGGLARAMLRARAGQTQWIGRIETSDDEHAVLRTEAGETLRIDLRSTDLVGFGQTAIEGPCVVLGTRAPATGGAYRSDLDEIRSAIAVQGSPADAWDRARTIQRIAFRRAVSTGWAACVVPLLVALFC